jgi:acyl-coenzyme A synthetase/AMP-(fatty) acid ligase
MGDVGYLDAQDRFWFCGRKSHRVRAATGTLFTIPCEAIYNQHPSVYRSALVGLGVEPQIPAIVVEPWPEAYPRTRRSAAQLMDELHARGRAHERTRSIEHIFIRRRLPVDIRHNSKIFREQLAVWAAERIGRASS